MEKGILPLILEAMTLRGLGSYLHGARLEIRPLTILCGTNGSGKSTWFRILRILQASSERGTLPFSFEDDLRCGDEDQHDYTNPLVRPSIGFSCFLVSAAEDRDFGEPGTVGLHIKSSATFCLAEIREALGWPSEEEDSPVGLLASDFLPHSFLSRGLLPQGTRFRVRMTAPTFMAGIHESFFVDRSLNDRMVELVINEIYSIRFERRHPSTVRHYTATCTRAFWPGSGPDDLTDMVVAEFDLDDHGSPINVCAPSEADSFELRTWFCRVAIDRIRFLLAMSVYGVHWIGAIRSIERRARVDEKVFNDPDIVDSRYVGGEGEYAQVLARRFAYNEMRLAEPRGQGSINYCFSRAGSDVLEKLLAVRDSTTPSPTRRIRESASEQSRQAISPIEPSKGRDAEIRTAQVRNDALRRRDLFDPNYWPDLSPEKLAFLFKNVSCLGRTQQRYVKFRGLAPPTASGRLIHSPAVSLGLEPLAGTRAAQARWRTFVPAADSQGDIAPGHSDDQPCQRMADCDEVMAIQIVEVPRPQCDRAMIARVPGVD
ncbi:MAG: hypothetical protein ACHRXM_16460 [Isosphaerales bacterium]